MLSLLFIVLLPNGKLSARRLFCSAKSDRRYAFAAIALMVIPTVAATIFIIAYVNVEDSVLREIGGEFTGAGGGPTKSQLAIYKNNLKVRKPAKG